MINGLIEKNDYNLNIPRYVDTFEEEANYIIGDKWIIQNIHDTDKFNTTPKLIFICIKFGLK